MKKEFLVNKKGKTIKVMMTFEELYDQFFNMVQKETWAIVRRYGKIISKEEAEQQFTIELWKTFEKYDIEKGNCVSTYIYNRFLKARRDLLYPKIGSERSKWEKENVSSMARKVNDDDRDDASNKEFKSDRSFQQIVNADEYVESEDLLNVIREEFSDQKDLDLVLILIDKKGFSVADYAKKWNISRVAANNRLRKMKETLSEVLADFAV